MARRKYEVIGPDGKMKKVIIKREGDWLCPKCKNINFENRKKCNRCQLDKPEKLNNKEEDNHINDSNLIILDNQTLQG